MYLLISYVFGSIGLLGVAIGQIVPAFAGGTTIGHLPLIELLMCIIISGIFVIAHNTSKNNG